MRASRRSSRRCSTARAIIESLEAERTIEARGRIENLEELVGVAREYDGAAATRCRRASLSGFLQEISLYSDQDALRGDEEGDGGQVTLMTLHNAKGLEFRAVFMLGMEEGIFPHARSIEENSLEEERRLCLRRHDAREGAADADARDAAQPVRPQRGESPVAVPRRAAAARASSGSGCGRRRGRTTAASVQREFEPRTDVPDLSTGDTVRHASLGTGIVTQIEPGGVVTVRFEDGSERRLMLEYAPLERLG